MIRNKKEKNQILNHHCKSRNYRRVVNVWRKSSTSKIFSSFKGRIRFCCGEMKEHKYLPEGMDDAAETVMTQMETILFPDICSIFVGDCRRSQLIHTF